MRQGAYRPKSLRRDRLPIALPSRQPLCRRRIPQLRGPPKNDHRVRWYRCDMITTCKFPELALGVATVSRCGCRAGVEISGALSAPLMKMTVERIATARLGQVVRQIRLAAARSCAPKLLRRQGAPCNPFLSVLKSASDSRSTAICRPSSNPFITTWPIFMFGRFR